MTSRFDYAPYGQVTSSLGNETARLFTGHEWEPSLAQYFAPFRYYDPQRSTWTKSDDLGMIDGPNTKAYVIANPIGYWDPLGLACGPGGIGDVIIPDKCLGFNFRSSCEEHDDCYGGCGDHAPKKRKQCDKEFLKNMRKQCAGAPPGKKHACKACAYIYYKAVDTFGKGPYDSDNRGGPCCGG